MGVALAKEVANPDLTPMPGDFQAGPDALGTGLGLGTIKGVFNTKDFLTTGAGMFGAPPIRARPIAVPTERRRHFGRLQ